VNRHDAINALAAAQERLSAVRESRTLAQAQSHAELAEMDVQAAAGYIREQERLANTPGGMQ